MIWLSKPPLGTQLNFSNSLNKGLAGFWLFNEGMGDTVYDISNNHNNSISTTISQPPTSTSGWNPGIKGSCMIYNGVDDSSSTTGNSTIKQNLQSQFTFGIRIYQSKDDANVLLYFYMSGCYEIGVDLNEMFRFSYRNSAGAWRNDWNTGISCIKNAWQHVLFTFDGNTIKLYLNGAERNSTTITTLFTSVSNLLFSGDVFGSPSVSFDEVRIWNRCLTKEEILKLYTNPYCMFINTNIE